MFGRVAIRCGVVVVCIAGSLGAQATGYAAVDSAAVARAAWQRANAAARADRLGEARAEAARAATAWPTQPAYVWGTAVLAAQAGDTVALARALRAYADLGLGRDLAHEPSLATFAGRTFLAPLIAQHNENRRSAGRVTPRAWLPDSTFWPEGMDVDTASGTIYVASVRHGTVAAIARDGSSRELIPRGAPGYGAVLGVRADARRGVVWVTTSALPQREGQRRADSTVAALIELRASDGAVLRRFDLAPSPGGHVLGDLAIGPRGDVYVTDSQEPVLYRLAPGADALVALRHPLFRSLQGIAPTPDGRALYVADYSHGILRVELTTWAVTRVADAPRSTSLGCDGLAWDRGAIIAVQNGVAPARIVRFTLRADGTAFTRADVLEQGSAEADEPTIGAVVGDAFVFVANSQWEKYDDAGALRPGAVLRKPVLLAVPLRP
jgi:DNA-binding beta-propeller fold protein YncE